MSVTTNNKANKFANPNNAVNLNDTVNCGCEDPKQCQANYTYVYDAGANTITITDNSYLQVGDDLLGVNSIDVTVQDSVQPVSGSVNVLGDESAPIVVAVGALDATGTFRIDYSITTTAGCTDTVSLFFTPSVAGDATGSPDPYNDVR